MTAIQATTISYHFFDSDTMEIKKEKGSAS